MKIGEFVWILEHVVMAGGRFRTVDQYNLSAPLTKRDAAKIMHELLDDEYGEMDEDDWSAARELKDLYDCSRCVWHIAQMYVKGIMEADSVNIFGGSREVMLDEAKVYVERLMDPSKRVRPLAVVREPLRQITLAEMAEEIPMTSGSYRFIDVRSPEEHRNHPVLPGSENIPMRDLYLNPLRSQADLSETLFLYCDRGYQSGLAAKAMMDAGYRKVVAVRAS